jgi:hypothetical protein
MADGNPAFDVLPTPFLLCRVIRRHRTYVCATSLSFILPTIMCLAPVLKFSWIIEVNTEAKNPYLSGQRSHVIHRRLLFNETARVIPFFI